MNEFDFDSLLERVFINLLIGIIVKQCKRLWSWIRRKKST